MSVHTLKKNWQLSWENAGFKLKLIVGMAILVLIFLMLPSFFQYIENRNGTVLNLEFEEGRKIVQEWYFGEQEAPSIVTIILHPDKKGTSAELKHSNIPDEAYQDIIQGWQEAYFGALIDFYA